MRRWIALSWLLVVAVLGFSCSMGEEGAAESEPASVEASGDVRPEPPTATMRIVFEAMSELIPLSLDEARWSDPRSRDRILAALDRLETAADGLERHGRSREAGFGELALNLGRDFMEARERYRIGAYDESRFFLMGSMQSCVACHVRLPSTKTFGLGEELTNRVEVQALDPREKAWLMVTVRRFDDALEQWELLLADPQLPPGELDASGVLVDYLNVAIRVRGDVPRAQRALEGFGRRPDLPVYLARRVDEWRAALAALDPARFAPGSTASLELGVSLARAAEQATDGPYGRDGLIEDLAAASQLVRWLESDRVSRLQETRNPTDAERADTARAYYWLGVVEARSLDGFWTHLSERHLEAAIRADPRGPMAEKAYTLLEETQVLGYGGASGTHLPADVWSTLKELRELMGVEEPAASGDSAG